MKKKILIIKIILLPSLLLILIMVKMVRQYSWFTEHFWLVLCDHVKSEGFWILWLPDPYLIGACMEEIEQCP